MRKGFFEAGADGLVCGEIYHEWNVLKAFLRGQSDLVPQSFIHAADPDRAIKRVLQKRLPLSFSSLGFSSLSKLLEASLFTPGLSRPAISNTDIAWLSVPM